MSHSDSLRARLHYEPTVLQFGTSGRRGLVTDLTQLEVFINVLAELTYLQGISLQRGGILTGEVFFFAADLRPSSIAYVPDQCGYGEIAQAVEVAIQEAGMQPVYLGHIPTPALAYYALLQQKGSIMVTGSHIPFDRNGYKTYSSQGELLKQDEVAITEKVHEVRERLYSQPYSESLFNENGFFRHGSRTLPLPISVAEDAYKQRYIDFFGENCLTGLKLAVYQHSAVGRDLLADLLRRLGAEVMEIGRCDTFSPIDTENICDEQLTTIQSLYCANIADTSVHLDAVVSTDGDSDRPLVFGVESHTGMLQFFGGDVVGMITADYLGADSVVVPITCNDGIDRGPLRERVEPKTRVGSPFVILGMREALAKGKQLVCGWEANGGFLLGSKIEKRGKHLSPLMTRDAVLPIVAVLLQAKERSISVTALFDYLPQRYSYATLIPNIPRTRSMECIRRYSLPDSMIDNVLLIEGKMVTWEHPQHTIPFTLAECKHIYQVLQELTLFFNKAIDIGKIVGVNYCDGMRIVSERDEIIHLRPSGNADELRIYTVSDSKNRAVVLAEKTVFQLKASIYAPEQEHHSLPIPPICHSTDTVDHAVRVPVYKNKFKRVSLQSVPIPAPLRKPEWIRIRLSESERVSQVKRILRDHSVYSVCEEASCPNLNECFGRGTATFMILGNVCTRRCPFCDVAHGRPVPPDITEPKRLAETIYELGLEYVVITSVDRDDLRDGGASHFAACIHAIRERTQKVQIESLVPDFRGRMGPALDALEIALPDVFNHNLETVRRLYKSVRPGANYDLSLNLLSKFKSRHPGIPTKSGLMLGLGETQDEIHQVMVDLRNHNCDRLTLGQYLSPSLNHLPVVRYVAPEEFREWGKMARNLGFSSVASAPLVRSSYHAEHMDASSL